MREQLIKFTVLLLVCAFSLGLYSQQSAEQLFQSAVYSEEVEGNLERAITIYKKIIENFPDNRKMAARAQYQIGKCYQKQGLKKAQQAFQLVVDKYPDQVKTVQAAREKLAIILKGLPAAGKPATEPAMRQLVDSIDKSSAYGNVSPDGRYFALVDWDDGNIIRIDLKTGKRYRVTTEGNWNGPSPQDSDVPIWSPNSKKIAYVWCSRDEKNRWELRMIGREGGKHRLITPLKGYAWLWQWSKDGRYILAKDHTEDNLILISVEDGSVRALKTNGPYGVSNLSPNGKTVVTDFYQKGTVDFSRDIHLFTTDGTTRVPLIEHAADDRSPYWTPDGKAIVFLSNRSGTHALWLQRVVDMKATGAPEMIMTTGSVDTFGFSDNGSYYMHRDISEYNVNEMTIDVEARKVLKAPTIVSQGFVNSNSHPCWSPDGKTMAYLTWPAMDRFAKLVFFDVNSGQERSLDLEARIPRGIVKESIWSPDGKTITISVMVSAKWPGLFRINVQNGTMSWIKEAAELPDARIIDIAWSPDGHKMFYITYNENKRIYSIISHNLESKEEKTIYQTDPLSDRWNMRFALSPDGKKLVFASTEREKSGFVHILIKIMSTAGGEARVLMDEPESEILSWSYRAGMVWTPDGRHIIFGRVIGKPGRNAKIGLYRVPATGGKSQLIGEPIPPVLTSIRIHPDGQRICYTVSRMAKEAGIWVLENFLPKKKK